MSAMLPWAQTYAYMCSMFFIPLSTIFIFRNTMQGCGYGFLPMMGGVAELLARLVVSIFAMKILNLLWRSGSLDCSCCIYRYFLPLCYAKNRTISSCLNNIIPHPLPYNSRMPLAFLNFLMSISLFYHSFNKNSVSFAGIIYQNMGYRSNDFSILQNRSSAQPLDNPTGFPNQIRICHLKTNALI